MKNYTDKKEKIIRILKNQVTPALGCTEPGAVALSTARVKEILNEPVEKLIVSVDKNVLKNGMGVGIPGTKERGNAFAAALALVVGKSEYGLEVLKKVNNEAIEVANELINNKVIEMQYNEEADGLEIIAKAIGKNHTAKVIIRNSHTNIVFESKDNIILLDRINNTSNETNADNTKTVSLQQEIKDYSLEELIELAKTMPSSDLLFIQDGIEMNLRISEAGLTSDVGIGIGRYLMDSGSETVAGRAKAITAAASEARMAGWPLPVMSSAGSGNHGLTAILPIVVFGRTLNKSDDLIRRSVALSHMVTIYVKSFLGSLSPICGCGVAAGVGCSAGLTFLQDGNNHQIGAAIDNMISGLSGMLCDGAKLSCSYKLALSVDAAIDAANLSLARVHIPSDNGILGETPELTIQNMAKVSVLGMSNTDGVIVDIMKEKCS